MDNHAHLIMQEKEEELAKEIDTIKGSKKFTNMDENDIFIDIDAKENRMEEKQAIKLWNGLDKRKNIRRKIKNI